MKKLFGTDGIRGITGQYPLTEEIIFYLGKAISETLSIKKVLVADDSRKGSEWILNILASGLNHSDIELDYTGVITTPALSKIVSLDEEYQGGIMISASHNPPEFNGIKILNSAGMKLKDELEIELEERIFEFIKKNRKPDVSKGKIVRVEKRNKYIDFVKSKFKKIKDSKKLVIDCSNGATSSLVKIFSNLGYEIKLINCRPTGENINKNCGSLFPEKVAEEVRKEKAFAGIAFDGDGDRVIMTDEFGDILNGDILIYIISKFYANRGYNAPVIGTIMSNLALEKKVKELGLEFYRTPVGDRYVWEKMVETGSLIGGETSGHIILRDYQITGDGIITALKILEIAEGQNMKLSELKKKIVLFRQHFVNIEVNKKIPLQNLKYVNEMKVSAKERFENNVRIVIRYSGTEPLLRIMAEGEEDREIEKFIKIYGNKIKNEIKEVSQ